MLRTISLFHRSPATNRTRARRRPVASRFSLVREGIPIRAAFLSTSGANVGDGTVSRADFIDSAMPSSHTFDAQALWTALKNGKFHFERPKDLSPDKLPSGTEVLSNASEASMGAETVALVLEDAQWIHGSSALVLRQCGRRLYELFKAIPIPSRRAIIIGTPGIGKSWLSNYFLYRASQEGREVVFEHVGRRVAWCFRNDGTVETLRNVGDRRYLEAVQREGVLYLFDAGGGSPSEPLTTEWRPSDPDTVVFASPNKKHYNQFSKSNTYEFFYPPWTWPDILAAQPFMARNTISYAELSRRFYHLGGVPRFLFAPEAIFEKVIRRLNAALAQLNTFQVNELVHASVAVQWDTVPNFAFVINSSDPFNGDHAGVALASEYVEEAIPQVLEQHDLELLLRFAIAYDRMDPNLVGSASGKVYEAIFPKVLERGGQLFVSEMVVSPAGVVENILTAGPNKLVSLPARPKTSQSLPTHGELDFDTLYWMAGNHPPVDGVFLLKKPGPKGTEAKLDGVVLVLVQSTASTRSKFASKSMHEEAERLLNRFPGGRISGIQLWCLVPPFKFRGFNFENKGEVREFVTTWNKNPSLPTFSVHKATGASMFEAAKKTVEVQSDSNG
eukprot:TRINITY_DN754_c0_g2_i1.p1 TRINITY_DN754_c0_g2~~TRINITY_DN754_c0_g2_i1.p1  ORF type:complete len:616 (-),score=103.63 TRINITY_DN754_c0_g2_i1:292-2139(-)